MNTAFLQVTEGDYFGKLAWDQRQFYAACGGDGTTWSNNNQVSILITHHGIDWLNDHSQMRVTAEIAPAGRFAVHLFGHMHVARSLGIAEGGGAIRNLWQGKSLFGLENFGEVQKETRLHGYSVGTIGFDETKIVLRQWPRRGRFHKTNGWQLIPDHDLFSLTADEGTAPIELSSHAIDRRPQLNGRAKKSSTNWSQTNTRTKTWNWPSSEVALASYCAAVCKAHSQIRFVEIPYLKDVSDVELDSLFVEPRLSENEIHPDMNPVTWRKCEDAFKVLTDHAQLVLLGDPGTGKSTLISCLSWQLCKPRPTMENKLVQSFFGFVPLPIILRELNLTTDLTWETLIQAFLEHRIGKLLQQKTVDSVLKEGRALVLLDGLDEIGNLTIRCKLKAAVHTGMATYPESRWVMTSRIVGYEQVPFHYETEKVTIKSIKKGKLVEHSKRVRTEMSTVFFHAPFTDEQILRFSLNWYSQHEQEMEIVSTNAKDFVDAIRENEGTQRLARIPYLLTLMALVHHKHARLPHGRTELYERIATAYLESIDVRRRLNQLPYSLAQKKRWLADVAFRMQLRRNKKSSKSNQANLLAGKTEVQRWLRAAMFDAGSRESRDDSETLLRYFAQRSGLLVPRGEGKFAFMHLSLQEYFAATFLEARLTSSRFSQKNQRVEPTNEQLRSWVNSDVWRETFVLLFELLSAKPTAETEGLLDYLFQERLRNDTNGHEIMAAVLLAELITDPFVVLSTETGRKMKQLCWRWVFGRERASRSFWSEGYSVPKSLLRDTKGNLLGAWKAASISQTELRALTHLNLVQCSDLIDLRPLSQLKNLVELNLAGCTALEDLAPLATLKKLEGLSLEGCVRIRSLEPIANLRSLKLLVLGDPIDLSPLSRLELLEELHLHYRDKTGIDLTPLVNLSNLRSICTFGTPVRVTDAVMRNHESITSIGVRIALDEATLSRNGKLFVGSTRRRRAAVRRTRQNTISRKK